MKSNNGPMMTRLPSSSIRTVAIIGAGPSGLATAKYLLAEKSFSRIVIYEKRDTVGGTWNFTPLTPKSRVLICDAKNKPTANDVVTAGIPELNTPMYEHLEANLPHTLMQFSDKSFPKHTQLFPSRECVMQYLEDYAKELYSMIEFQTEVTEVKPRNCDDRQAWDFTTKLRNTEETKTEQFDAVVVANGHCALPLLPPIRGLDEWAKRLPKSLCHSVSYRNSEAFKDKRVLLVGGGPSAADIGHQIANVCQYPLLAARPEKSPYHMDEPNELEKPILVSLNPNDRTAVFDDESIERDIDIIFLCTGYEHTFPFLTSTDAAFEKGAQSLHPYQYIFDMQYPTLAFVETLEMIVPFPLAECQAAVIARVWSGRLALPNPEDTLKWIENVVKQRGNGRGFHAVRPPLDLQYMKAMYDWSNQAERNDMIGKMPRFWDDHACWLRMQAAEMKKAFNARGEERHDITSYEELGFRFDEPK